MLRDVQYKLRFAIKPSSDSSENAMTYALLMTLNFASVMRCRFSRPIKIFVDRDALAGLKSLINLHAHHHEELVARTEKELAKFQDIMNEPLSKRIIRHRSWYHRILHKKLKKHQDAVHILDIDSFCQTLKTAEKIIFFESASLKLLERLMRKEVESNMNCYLQAVRRDSQRNDECSQVVRKSTILLSIFSTTRLTSSWISKRRNSFSRTFDNSLVSHWYRSIQRNKLNISWLTCKICLHSSRKAL